MKNRFSDSQFGQNVVLGNNVSLGKGCIIGNNVVIHADTSIGSNVRIDDNSVIGKDKMKAPNSAMATDQKLVPTTIGNDVLIGACVVIYRAVCVGNKVLIADQASIQFNTKVGDYSIIGRGVLVESSCTIGSRVKLESNTYITAFSEIGDYCFIAPGVCTSNDNFAGRDLERKNHFKGVVVMKGGRIGVNATLCPGVTIHEDGFLAAGSLLTKDIPQGKIYAGVPAKEFRDVPEAQLLKNNL